MQYHEIKAYARKLRNNPTAAEKLIIELDGSVHENQVEEDERRQSILENLGFTVIRFKNQELSDIEKVLKTITKHLSE